jgi:hypothetical protein
MGILNKYKGEIIIVITAFLCWGRLIGMEGMWQDDWAWVWLYFGASSASEVLNPFYNMGHNIVGYIDYSLLLLLDLLQSKAPDLWHTTMFLIHTLNALMLYYIVRLICNNDNIFPALFVSVLYLVSPAVNNLYLMVQISYELLVLLYLLSLLFTILALIRNRDKIFFYSLSLVFAGLSMAGLESFIALEFSRPLLIGYLLWQGRGKDEMFRFKTVLIYSAPFLFLALILVIKRLNFVPAGGYTGYNELQIFSLEGILETLRLLYLSLSHMFIKSWYRGMKFINDLSTVSIFSILIATGSYAGLLRYGMSKGRSMSWTDNINRKALWFLALYGIIVLLFGILPYNAVGKYPQYGLDSRHATIAKIGYPIFIVSLLFLVSHYNKIIRKILPLIFGIVFFAGLVSSHGTIDYAANNWQHQRSIWWQFMWRAPDIKPNTLMIIDMPWPESPGGGSYVLPSAMNLAYARARTKTEIFSHYAFELRNAFRTDETNYRAIHDRDVVAIRTFMGSVKLYPKNLIAASYKDGYLYINDEITAPTTSAWSDVKFMISIAAKDRIIYDAPDTEFPFRWILGPEPVHDRRYYYQRANALAGMNDYKGMANLLSEAKRAGYDPGTILPQNLMQFINAFYASKDYDRGRQVLPNWANKGIGRHVRAVKMTEELRSKENELHNAMKNDID